jgi:hypothetical protein
MTAANQQATEGAAGTRTPAETVELPSIEELSRRASERAWSIRSMNVESDQTISFLRITRSDLQQVGLTAFPTDGREAIRLFKEKAQSAQVVIKAAMDRRRFDVRMWNRGHDRMITRYVIERIEDAAVIREKQWYPIQNDYRTVTYTVDPGDNPPLVEGRLESCLLDAVEESSCALGNFEAHWLPEDRNGSGFLTNLVFHAVGRAETVVEAKDEESGEISYLLRRVVYDTQNDVEGEPQPRQNCRYDLTTLDAASMDITARTLVLASIRPDKQGAYILVECQYQYTNVLTDSDAGA